MKLKERIKLHDWYVLVDIMTILGPALIFIIIALLTSCSVTKEIPVQTIEKIEYRDSLIYVHDTVNVEVPYEKIVQVLPKDTTSIINTSIATSKAELIEGLLHHELEQKGTVKTQIDTFYITQIKEVEKIVEVPVEVTRTEYKRDGLFWYLLIFHIMAILYLLARLYFK